MLSTIPSISDKLYIGAYCKDCACQSDREEIVQLKNATKILKNVHHEIELLKNELTFTRDSLRSSFYDELQSNGKTMYYQLTDKLDALRDSQRKALETIRLSYRSQLHDFISQAKSIINSEKSSLESGTQRPRAQKDSIETTFFHQAAIKGYETEINNLKLEIEQLRETSQHEIKLATTYLNDEKTRLSRELAAANQSLNHLEDTLTKRDQQIRDLKYDISSLQTNLKEAKKVVVREPDPPRTVPTQARLTQTDPWVPPPAPSNNKSDTTRKEVMVPKKPTVVTLEPENPSRSAIEKLESKYEAIIREKDEQIQDLLEEINSQPKASFPNSRIEKHTSTEERHRSDLKRYAEKHRQDIQMWQTKYDILHRSMMVLRDEMYTRQNRISDRFNGKAAVST